MPPLAFTRRHDTLVAFDSDGCVFDSMEIKHKECFIPEFIRWFGLQAVSKYAREAAEFVNLYSKTRGVNRFPAYVRSLDLLAERTEVQARKFMIPKISTLREWVRTETRLSTGSAQAAAEKTGAADLRLAANWSAAVDMSIKSLVHGVPPFPGVRDVLERLRGQADIIVCSATPTPALVKEWEEHGLAEHVSVICGQELGSKKEILNSARDMGYASARILMIGDAPGDMQAAQSVGAAFFPINPGHEEASWNGLNSDSLTRFLLGGFIGEHEQALHSEFEQCLPESPPWLNVSGRPEQGFASFRH